jgi:hypothetical protein
MNPLLCTIIGVFSVCAQTSSTVTGPMLGVVFDASTGTVRPLAGIPASAILGDPFDAGVTLSLALPAPGQTYAVGTEVDTGTSVLLSGEGRSELPGVKSGASRIAISPRGRAAAFYFADSVSVQIVSGLPGHPVVVREVYPGGTPSVLAVSDDAQTLLAAVDQDGGQAVIFDQAGQGSRLLRNASRVVAMEFFPDSRNALFAESSANAVWVIQNADGPQVTSIADERDGITDTVGLAASTDGATVFIAMRSGQVAIRNVSSGEQTLISCSCQPSGLSRLRGNAVFRLNDVGDGPVWILDASGEQPRILFVAAAARSEQ